MLKFYTVFFLIGLILPLWYVYSFWLYTIQLKEYRIDRFKEYLFTYQGKKALFNVWFFLEIPLFFLGLSLYFYTEFIDLIVLIFGCFLVLFNVFVVGKIAKHMLLKPKMTGRLILTLVFLLMGFIVHFYFILLQGQLNSLFVYIAGIFICAPLHVFLSIFLSLPIVNYLKNKNISSAIKKSEGIQGVLPIGITGSYGKSSVKEFLSSILSQDSELLKTPNNINSELGVSAVVLRELSEKYRYFVAEMGAYRIGEISLLGKIVNHKHAFLTAIGNQHIGLFGSQENISIAKIEIQESVIKNKGILYVNWNNENIRNAHFDERVTLVKYGSTQGSDALYSSITQKEGNTTFIFSYKKVSTLFSIHMVGEHNVVNITGVIACCIDLGLDISDIKLYIKKLQGPCSTKETSHVGKHTLIDDTYNLSESGLLSGLEVLSSYEGKKILVMDDILELGSESDDIHYRLGQKIGQEKLVDGILFCGVNYKKSFMRGLKDGGFHSDDIIQQGDFQLGKKMDTSIFLFEGKKSKRYFHEVQQYFI